MDEKTRLVRKKCDACGAEIHAEAVVCPSCGANQESVEAKKETTLNKLITRFKTDKKLWVIVGGAFAAIAIIITIALTSYMTSFAYYVDLMLDKYPFADNTRSADGSTLQMDTNPYDKNPNNMTIAENISYSKKRDDTFNGIKWMNEKLGFDSSVYEDMLETSYLSGRQTRSNDKYTVSWTYHTTKGLEVIYSKK